mmetsp:Transcript_55729/g.76097  ORF Transcript_55729/g.76097 Transcript_55729/m.76097 type:complete len:156 (+) Transcript_55729:199-666(+)
MATAQVSSDALPRGTSAVAWTIENLTDIWEECKKADGCRGNEVSRLEEKLDLEGIKVHLDAGKGRRVTGKSLAEFTKRVFGEYKKLMRHRNKETVSKKITKFLNTPISFKPEGQSPEKPPLGRPLPSLTSSWTPYTHAQQKQRKRTTRRRMRTRG